MLATYHGGVQVLRRSYWQVVEAGTNHSTPVRTKPVSSNARRVTVE